MKILDIRGKGTLFLTLILIIIWLITEFAGGTTNISVLLLYGANIGPLVQKGQYFRLFTSCFLHGGFIHLAMNLVGIRSIGEIIEYLLGPWIMLAIFVITGTVGAIFSFLAAYFAGEFHISIGASGGLSGLFGIIAFLSFFGNPSFFPRSARKSIFTIIAINVIFGIVVQNVDNWAHLGGFLSGIFLAFLLKKSANHPNFKKMVPLLFLAMALIILIFSIYQWLLFFMDPASAFILG